MSKKNCILFLLIAMLLQNCNTYKRSFGQTYTTINVENYSKTYRLDLSNTSLRKTPNNLANLTELRILNLSGNKLLNLEEVFNTITNPEKLEVLILDSLDLKIIPKSILKFKNLKQLSLNKNPHLNFVQATEIIETLPIRFLNLQQNSLENIPFQIAKITSLTGVNLSNNKIKNSQAFETLAKLPNLKSLWLTNNKIYNLPEEIGLFTSLRNLYLEHNYLTTLPNSVKNLKKVTVLHLGYNQFKELPIALIKMPKLMLLHINNCGINTISNRFKNSKYSLKSIILDNNKLSEEDKKKWRKVFKSFIMASF